MQANIIVLCGVDTRQLGYLCCVLSFGAILGFKMNLGKSTLIRVGDVPNVGVLASILGCKVESSAYLGWDHLLRQGMHH